MCHHKELIFYLVCSSVFVVSATAVIMNYGAKQRRRRRRRQHSATDDASTHGTDVTMCGDSSSSSTSTEPSSNHGAAVPLEASVIQTDSFDSTAKVLNTEQLAAQFPSLAEPLTVAPILGLYFCAAWCDDCVRATPRVEKVISNQNHDDQLLVQVVYVSSDTSAQEMARYKPRIFREVPFDSVQERARLKRQFGVCARKELAELGLSESDRKHGTPCLVLIESTTGRVLTEYGVSNCLTGGSAADILEGWKLMLHDEDNGDDDSDDAILGLLATSNRKIKD